VTLASFSHEQTVVSKIGTSEPVSQPRGSLSVKLEHGHALVTYSRGGNTLPSLGGPMGGKGALSLNHKVNGS